jgi:deoxyribose-phosphate aldolase
VRQIGDEILEHLRPTPNGALTQRPAHCECGTGVPEIQRASTIPAAGSWEPPEQGIAGLIDHTLLKPDATGEEITRLCAEAREHKFLAVCVHPVWVARAVRELQGSSIRTVSVVGFPHGATVTPAKCAETEQILKLGATEIDMVIHVGALKAHDLDAVYCDIRAIVELAHAAGALVKVILEAALLNEEQKINGCVLAKLAGANFVKTSTGFGPSGANAADVALMRRVVGPEMGIKAAGGIRSLRALCELMAAGATRIGASASISILREAAAAGVAQQVKGWDTGGGRPLRGTNDKGTP